MKPMTPKGLEQSSIKKVNHVPKKVNIGDKPVIDDSVKLLDVLRLKFGKLIENTAFSELEISTGKLPAATGGAIGGMGIFAWVNWTQLFMGSWIEIVKLIICVAVIGLGLVAKK